MPIIPIILVLLLVGFVLYLLQTAPIPVHPWIKTLIIGVICFALIIWLLGIFGVNTGLNLRWS